MDYTPVEVVMEKDEFGQDMPGIIRKNGKEYHIKRILHICQPEDKVVRYTVQIGRTQRNLFFNGTEWRASAFT